MCNKLWLYVKLYVLPNFKPAIQYKMMDLLEKILISECMGTKL